MLGSYTAQWRELARGDPGRRAGRPRARGRRRRWPFCSRPGVAGRRRRPGGPPGELPGAVHGPGHGPLFPHPGHGSPPPAQEGHERIELVVVTASEDELRLEAREVEGLCGVRVVALGRLEGYGTAWPRGPRGRRAGRRAGETRSFPQPGWRARSSAATPSRAPRWARSWRRQPGGGPIARSNLLLDYGPWLAGCPGASDALPGTAARTSASCSWLWNAARADDGGRVPPAPEPSRARTSCSVSSQRAHPPPPVNTLAMCRESASSGRAFSHLRAREWSWCGERCMWRRAVDRPGPAPAHPCGRGGRDRRRVGRHGRGAPAGLVVQTTGE